MKMVVCENRRLLFLSMIKLLHTLVWLVYVLILAYIFYAVTAGIIDGFLWICIWLVCLEGLVLAVNKGKCPLTKVAARYSPSQAVGFDIFLPTWLAEHNQKIFTNLFIIELGVLAYRLLERYGFVVTS